MKLSTRWIKLGITPGLIALIAPVILEVINNMLGNIISDMLPKSVLVTVLLVALFACSRLIKNHHEQHTDTTQGQPQQPAPKAPAAPNHRVYSYTNIAAPVAPPIQPAPYKINHSAALPPLVDDSRGETLIDDPLPSRQPEKPVPSHKELVAALPAQPAKIKYRRRFPEQPKMLCWSPDSTQLAALFSSSPLQLIGEQDVISPPDWGAVQAASWSPDGQILAISTQGTIHFWNKNDGKESAGPLHIGSKPIYGMDWSPQQRLALWVGHEIRIFSFPGLENVAVFQTQHICGTTPGLLRWSSDGEWLVAGTSNGSGSLFCWHYDTSTSFQLSAHLRPFCMAWHPASTLLSVAFSSRQIITWDVARRQQVAMLENLAAAPHTMSISPRYGMLLASLADDLLVSTNPSSCPTGKYTGHWIAEWSPDDTAFATLDPGTKTAILICSLPLRAATS